MNTARSAAAPVLTPGTNAEINGLTTGVMDNNFWFTQVSYGAIGRLTTNGVATVFYLANSNCEPGFIASRSGWCALVY